MDKPLPEDTDRRQQDDERWLDSELSNLYASLREMNIVEDWEGFEEWLKTQDKLMIGVLK